MSAGESCIAVGDQGEVFWPSNPLELETNITMLFCEPQAFVCLTEGGCGCFARESSQLAD